MIGPQEDGESAEVGPAATSAMENAAAAVQHVAEAADETASAASDRAWNAASDAGGMVAEAVDATRQNVAAGVRQATEFVSGVGDEAIAQVTRRPAPTVLLVAGTALVIGFIVGAVSTKRG